MASAGGETANAGPVQEGADPKAAAPSGEGQASPEQGVPTGDWREGLSIEEIQKLSRFKDPKAVAKSYLELEKRLGSAVSVPGENAKPEEIRAFLSKLGVPEKADGYELKTPAEEDGWSKEVEGQARDRFLKAGLTPKQAQEMINLHVELVEKGAQALNDGAKQAESQLKSEWGSGFKRNWGFAMAALEEYFGADGISELSRNPLGNSVSFLKGLARLGADLNDAGYVRGEPANVEDIQSQLNALRADRSGPLWNKTHPGHQAAVDRSVALEEQLIHISKRPK
jgi:hypothetical protein